MQTNDWAVWLILAFIVIAGVGLGLLTAWGNDKLQLTRTTTTTTASTASTPVAATTATAIPALATASSSAASSATGQNQKTIVRSEEVTENAAALKPKSTRKVPDMRDFNRPVRKSKCVGPVLIKMNFNRQPPKRPTSYGPTCGGNKSTITKEDVDVIYDDYNWVAWNGCFNEKGVYENPLNPKDVPAPAIELDGGVGTLH
jgi:hypothetical protein